MDANKVATEVIRHMVGYSREMDHYEQCLKNIDLLLNIPADQLKHMVLARAFYVCQLEDCQRERDAHQRFSCDHKGCKTVARFKDMVVIDTYRYCRACVDTYYTKNCIGCNGIFFTRNEQLCENCRARYAADFVKVGAARTRARKEGLPASLSDNDWLATLKFFNHRCAYCGGDYQCIEHFIPISRGGGSTITNCVPACYSCNSKKKDLHPYKESELIAKYFGVERLSKIMQYIEQAEPVRQKRKPTPSPKRDPIFDDLVKQIMGMHFKP